MGAFDGDACPLPGALDQFSDGGVGFAGGWVGKDVSAGLTQWAQLLHGFGRNDGVAGLAGFCAAKIQSAIVAQVLPFQVSGLDPAQAGFVDDLYQQFFGQALGRADALLIQAVADGFHEPIEFTRIRWLGQRPEVAQFFNLEWQGPGIAPFYHPTDDGFEVVDALVAVGRGVFVLGLEFIEEYRCEVFDRMPSEDRPELGQRPDHAFVVAGGAMELEPLQIFGQDFFQSRVERGPAFGSILLAKFGVAAGGVIEAAKEGFVFALAFAAVGPVVDLPIARLFFCGVWSDAHLAALQYHWYCFFHGVPS